MAASLRIAFAGTPDFAVPALAALIDSRHEVVAVYTQPDRPAGRGRSMTAPPVKDLARSAEIPVYQPQRLTADQLRDTAGEIDLLIVVAFGQILPETVLAIPRHGAINVHASLLPRWRGAAPIARALLAGDRETGVSIMRMTAGLDAGPVLARSRCNITAEDTAGSLHDHLAELGADALLTVLDDLPRHLAHAQPQDLTVVTHAAKLTTAEARIDWTRAAEEIERAVRAFHPWPCAWTELHGERLRVLATEVVDNTDRAAPGTIIAAGPAGLDVVTGNGTLRLTRIQRAGKRAMAAGEWAKSAALTDHVLGVAS